MKKLFIFSLTILSLLISVTEQGTYKEKYCKSLWIKEKREDPNGQEYESQQLVTKSERKSAESLRSQLNVGRSKKEAKSDIVKMLNENTYMHYISSLLYIAAPFIILLAIGTIGTCTYWFCFFLEPHCCKRDLKKKPYSDSDMGRPAICIFVFGLGAIGMIIYGYLLATDFKVMVDKLKCATISIMDEVVFDTTIGSYQWIGLSNADTSLRDIMNNLDTAATQQEAYFSDTNWIDSDLEDLYAANNLIFSYYQDKEIRSPNRNSTSAVTVPSEYVKNSLGNENVTDSTVYNLKQGLDTVTKRFSQACKNTVTTTEVIKIKVDDIKDSLNEGRKQVQSTSDQFMQQIADTEDRINKQQKNNDLFYQFLQAFFMFQLIGSGFAFIGVLLTHCTGKRPKCRVLIHIGWFFMSFMMVLGLAISVFLVPLGVMLTEACDWMVDVLKNEEEFNDKSYKFVTEELRQKISKCKFGGGDLTEEFNMQDSMGEITAMINSLTVTTGLTNSTNENYIDITAADAFVTAEITRLTRYINGLEEDSVATDEDNSYVSIANFNLWADHSLTDSLQKDANQGNCQATQDKYVFDSSQCDGYQAFNEANGANDNLGQQTCIIINSISVLDQSTRYGQIQTGANPCSNIVEQRINAYFTALYQHDMNRRSFFLSIQSDINNNKASQDAYHTKLSNFVTQASQYQTDIAALITSVNDPNNGLMSRFNCSFLGESLDRVYDAVCVSFVTPVFKGILSTAVASICMFFCSFFSFILAIRYARQTRAKQVSNANKNVKKPQNPKGKQMQ